MPVEWWRPLVWIAVIQAHRQASEAYLRSGRPALARTAWWIANTLVRRGWGLPLGLGFAFAWFATLSP